MTDGALTPGMHFVLLASADLNAIEELLEENTASLQKVALAAADVPISMPSSSFANSGCTIHFFKNQDVFTLYKALDKVVGQSLKEGTKFTILGKGNIEL